MQYVQSHTWQPEGGVNTFKVKDRKINTNSLIAERALSSSILGVVCGLFMPRMHRNDSNSIVARK